MVTKKTGTFFPFKIEVIGLFKKNFFPLVADRQIEAKGKKICRFGVNTGRNFHDVGDEEIPFKAYPFAIVLTSSFCLNVSTEAGERSWIKQVGVKFCVLMRGVDGFEKKEFTI